MDLEAKIERIRELVDIRDEALAELEELIGGKTIVDPTPKKHKTKKTKTKSAGKKKQCVECGSKGTRHFKGCVNGTPVSVEKTNEDEKRCKACGGTGHRSDSFKCPLNEGIGKNEDPVIAMRPGTRMDIGGGNDEWKKLEQEEEKKKELMSESVFDEIKIRQANGETSFQCSVEHGLDIRQVNVAFGVSKYETYLEFAPTKK